MADTTSEFEYEELYNKKYLTDKNGDKFSPVVAARSVFTLGGTSLSNYLNTLMSKSITQKWGGDFNDLISYGCGFFICLCSSNYTLKNTPLGTVSSNSYHFYVLQLAGLAGGRS